MSLNSEFHSTRHIENCPIFENNCYLIFDKNKYFAAYRPQRSKFADPKECTLYIRATNRMYNLVYYYV